MRNELQRIARLTRGGDNPELLAWATESLLAGAQRPLRYDARFLEPWGRPLTPLPPAAREPVAAWTDRVESEGIKAIMCLATCRELARYDPLEYVATTEATGELPLLNRKTYERALSTGRMGGHSRE